jgi:hypothetical protein
MTRVIGLVFRYLALVLLVAAFALISPLWGLSQRMIVGLTSEEPYVRLVRDLGLGELAGGLLELTDLLPDKVLSYLESREGEGPNHIDELKLSLADAVDDAAVRVAAQVPAYVAGRRDELEGAVELGEFRRKALDAAVDVVPGGAMFGGWIRKAVESTVPERVSLDPVLGKLELVLEPIRAAVEGLLATIYWLRDLSVLLLMTIAVVAFRLSRAVRWTGIALVAAGAVGGLLGGLLSFLLALVVPDAVLENQLFQELLADSIEGFRGAALVWMGVGAGLLALSLVVPPVVRAIGRRWSSCPLAGLLRFTIPRGGATLATVLALLPAVLGYTLARGLRLRRGARAALGGRVVAAILFDAALPVGLVTLLAGDGFLGTTGWVVVFALMIPFWSVRDRPARLGGINLVDRLDPAAGDPVRCGGRGRDHRADVPLARPHPG